MIPLGILAATRVLGPPGYQTLTWTTQSPSNWQFTDGGRRGEVVVGSNNWIKAKAAAPKSAGKHYFEVVVVAQNGDLAIGVAPTSASTTTASGGNNNAGDGGRMQYFASGQKRRNGTYESYGPSFTAGDVIGIAYDADSRIVTAYKNGQSLGVMYTGAQVAATAHEPHVATYGAATVGTTLLLAPELTYLPAGYTGWTA